MAQTDSIINQDVFLEHLKKKINVSMVGAAEPIIQKALEDIESEMRQKLASIVVSLIKVDFNCERSGKDLKILVKQIITEREP